MKEAPDEGVLGNIGEDIDIEKVRHFLARTETYCADGANLHFRNNRDWLRPPDSQRLRTTWRILF
jgi:hypothetical protein